LVERAKEFGFDDDHNPEAIGGPLLALTSGVAFMQKEGDPRYFSAAYLHGLSRLVCICLSNYIESPAEHQEEVADRLREWRQQLRRFVFEHGKEHGYPFLTTPFLTLDESTGKLDSLKADSRDEFLQISATNEHQRDVFRMLLAPPFDRDNLFSGFSYGD
jgi:hypothetical protein